ncbi:response regulator [Candidatus Daviesbacteria bacterium]|nr:response regulator [Candidatus Daviesbacteria bacterium]
MAKVLIVEDDPILLKIYHKKFEIEGFQVETAIDGETGLTKIKTIMPNLVLMDIMLPKMNGIDAMEKAKADPQTANIPFLILTNLSTSSDAQEAMKKGAVGFLVKSAVTPAQVVAKVKEILKI